MKNIINILLFQFSVYFTYSQECGRYIDSILFIQMDSTFFDDDSQVKKQIIKKVCSCELNDIGTLPEKELLLLANKVSQGNPPPNKFGVDFYQVQLLYDKAKRISYGFMYWKESSVLDEFCHSFILYSPSSPMFFMWFIYDWNTDELLFK